MKQIIIINTITKIYLEKQSNRWSKPIIIIPEVEANKLRVNILRVFNTIKINNNLILNHFYLHNMTSISEAKNCEGYLNGGHRQGDI